MSRLPLRQINHDGSGARADTTSGIDLAVLHAMSPEPLTDALELHIPVATRGGSLRETLTRVFRTQLGNYLRVFAGTGVRLGLQAVYFFILANTLSLHDMGVFASASSTGIMIGCFSGFGFSSFAFRAAAGKRRALGGYLAVFYASWLLSLPLCVAASLLVYQLLFTSSLSLSAFVLIILADAGTWRIVEMIHQVNNGLGRYAQASLVIGLATAMRTIGTIAFMASGSHDVETWSVIYLTFNLAAMAFAIALYQPRIRLRWSPPLFFGRIRDALMFSIAYCAFISQNEIDKLVMMSLADQRTVGIYAISSRIIDFTAVPIRTFYVLYSRKLIRDGRRRGQIGRSLGVEMLIALVSTAGFAALLAVLSIWPDLLGHNVAAAAQLFGVLLAVPAFKNLLEYHSELFFAYQAMTLRAVLATSLVVLKAAALALLLVSFNGIGVWGPWLNVIYIGLYALSAAVVYRSIFGNRNP
jgi:O-antigen/teichoic acid export membrane protein